MFEKVEKGEKKSMTATYTVVEATGLIFSLYDVASALFISSDASCRSLCPISCSITM